MKPPRRNMKRLARPGGLKELYWFVRRIARFIEQKLSWSFLQLASTTFPVPVSAIKVALCLQPGFDCENSGKWLAAFDKVLEDYPRAILECRLAAFHRSWCLGDIGRGMVYQDKFREQQFLRRKKLKLPEDVIAVSRTIFTANHSVNGYLDTHLKAMALGMSVPKKIIALIRPGETVQNPTMMEIWQQYVDVIFASENEPVSRLLDFYEEDFTVSVPLNGRAMYIEHAKSIVQAEWEKQKRPPLLSLDLDFIRNRRLEMAEIGLGVDEPFVTLHVRDNGSKLGSWEKSGPEDFRNADITNYVDAIKSLTDLGFTVVRVGDPAMKPLPVLPGLIDYSRSEIRSSGLDLFLFTQCDFFVGTSSGPIQIPMLFGTPTIGTNYAPVSGRLHVGNSLNLPKRVVDPAGVHLTFEEVLSSALSQDYSGDALRESEWRYEENSPVDIVEACLEMVDILRGRARYTSEDEALQRKVKGLYQSLSPYGSAGRMGAGYLRTSEKLGMI